MKVDRRQLLQQAVALTGGGLVSSLMPAWAQSRTSLYRGDLPSVSGREIDLTIERATWSIDGQPGSSITLNGTLPGPIIRLKEGQRVTLRVHNRMDESTSVHWHGMLVPFQMDGVPGVTFPGIPPRSTFVYEFLVKQSGTYWYHSHTGFQEQEGLYGPIVIEPKEREPFAFDRDYVVMLSDFTFMSPKLVFVKLKQEGASLTTSIKRLPVFSREKTKLCKSA